MRCYTVVVVEKSMSVIHSDCVFVALVIQHEMRVRHIAICGLQYFRNYLKKGTIFFKEKFIDGKTCVLIFSTNFVCNFSHSVRNSAKYRVIKSLCAPDDHNPHTIVDLKMAITEYIRNVDRTILNTVF